MQDEIIWEGPVGRTPVTAQVVAIPNNYNRGIVRIIDGEGTELYQREVSVSRNQPFGGTKEDMQEWKNVIASWVANYS